MYSRYRFMFAIVCVTDYTQQQSKVIIKQLIGLAVQIIAAR